MENNKIMIRKYFSDDCLIEITMIQDEEKDGGFKANDVASIWGYSDKKKAIRMHVHDDDKKKIQWTTGVPFCPPPLYNE